MFEYLVEVLGAGHTTALSSSFPTLDEAQCGAEEMPWQWRRDGASAARVVDNQGHAVFKTDVDAVKRKKAALVYLDLRSSEPEDG